MLAVLLLSVPYLVDVAYYGDLTPTHFAQVVDSQGEKAVSGDEAVSSDDSPEDSLIIGSESVNAVHPSYSGDDSKNGPRSQFSAVASHTSRPPPLC
ncbi:MAG: protein of unknown function [Nitrospira sp.]